MSLVRCTCVRTADIRDVVLVDPLCPAAVVHAQRGLGPQVATP